MKHEKQPRGVRVRANSIEINFSRSGKRIYLQLNLYPTSTNLKKAASLRAGLIEKDKLGILTELDIDNIRNLNKDNKSLVHNEEYLFINLAKEYLINCEANNDTKMGYQKIINTHWLDIFSSKDISTIKVNDIRSAIISRNFTSNKNHNNCLTPLRGIFRLAMEKELISENPLDRISNKKIQKSIPDPFNEAEVKKILDWMAQNLTGREELYYWYYQLAFYTGCRPSELFALRESDFCFRDNIFHVSKSLVRGHEKRTTKTSVARIVDLHDKAIEAVHNLKKFKKKYNIESDYLLICPTTFKRFYNEKPPRMRFNKALKACNIRHRVAYNTRHTYATYMLMNGCDPFFVAAQLGHSLDMLLNRYAKWINGASNKIQMAKLK